MNYYQQPFFPFGSPMPFGTESETCSFIDDFLRINLLKLTTVHMNFGGTTKAFKGIIAFVGKDFIVLKDSNSQIRYFLPLQHLSYITFDDSINIAPEQKKIDKED